MLKKLLVFLFVVSLFLPLGCGGGPEEKVLTIKDIEREKAAIVDVIKAYDKAAEEKNFSKMVETLASNVIFFGTDSSEVIKTFADYRKKMLEQWKEFDSMKYGEPQDVSIQMDDNATWASIIFGVPFQVKIGDDSANLFLRVQRTLKKEKGKWVIVSGIVGFVNPRHALALERLILKKENAGEESEKK